ncbi:MAG TPA: hypothetical protein DCP71_10165, partial [Verrucomicrobiales bacterium]|nr:hypothetical protein [Verrucomicrobiales bacterium]
RVQDKDPASPLEFFIPESPGKGRDVQPKFQFTSGSVGDGVRDPRTAYLCTVWSLVPDALQAEASKAVHSLYLCYQRDQDTKYIQITRALQVDPKPGEGSKLEPAGMNLLRIFTMKGNLDGLIKGLLLGAEKNDFEKKLNIFIQWLYPDSHAGVVKNKDRIWSDAGGIPVRYSETIRFK